MIHARSIYAGLLFLAVSVTLTGCYTQLASNKGDNYGYTGRVHRAQPVRTDTINVQQHTSIAQSEPQMVYDTIMKGDTMFIEEHERPAATEQYTSGETVVNNYYDGYGNSPYDYGWFPRPRSAFSITIGYPYGCWPIHSWYSPWYSYYPDYGYPYDWGYGYPGYYPPIYDAYYGYGGFYRHSPYYSGYYGGGYGYNDHHGILTPVRRVGRTPGGDRGPGVTNIAAMTGRPNMITVRRPMTNGVSNLGQSGMRLAEGTRTSGESAPRESADRNAPVHVVSPGSGEQVTHAQTGVAESQTANRSVEASSMNGASTSRLTAITNASTAAPNGAAHRVVVVRRAYSGSSQGGYNRSAGGNRSTNASGYSRSSGRGYNSGSSGNSSGRDNGGSRATTETRSSGGETRSSGSETRSSGGESRGGGGGGGRSR